MRCEPGDLAVVVNDLEDARNNGALVRVLRRADPSHYDIPAEWECLALSSIRFSGGVTACAGKDLVGYRDRELRPIRDPGDDVRDPRDVLVPEVERDAMDTALTLGVPGRILRLPVREMS